MKTIVVIPTNRPKDWQNIRDNLTRQSVKPDILITIENGQDFSWTDATHILKSHENVGLARQTGLDFVRKNYPGSFVMMMDGDDYYGRHYVKEAIENRDKADIIGKHCVFYWLSASKKLALSTGYENQFCKIIHGPTMAFTMNDKILNFEGCPGWGEDLSWQKRMLAEGFSIYATSKFNFTGIRKESIDLHTWYMPEFAVARAMKLEKVIPEANIENKFSFCEKDSAYSLEKPPVFSINI